MNIWFKTVVKFVKSTPNRSFILYPVIVLLWELVAQAGKLTLDPYYLILLPWGYGQYRLCGRYRIKRGGGGPGLEKPPERLVTTGIYRFTRNPMYLGHIIFLTGVTLTLHSLFALFITLGTVIWFQYRVLGDERRLVVLFGDPYRSYMQQVRRWIPGVL